MSDSTMSASSGCGRGCGPHAEGNANGSVSNKNKFNTNSPKPKKCKSEKSSRSNTKSPAKNFTDRKLCGSPVKELRKKTESEADKSNASEKPEEEPMKPARRWMVAPGDAACANV